MDDLTIDQLNAKIETLEASVKAQEDEKKEDAKKATRKASIKKAMEHMDDEKKAKFIATLKSSDDEDEKKIASELEDEHKKDSKTKKGTEHEDDKKDATDHEKKELESKIAKLSATVESYEAKESANIIDSLVALKASNVPGFDEQTYRTTLQAKSFTELSALAADRADEIATLQASTATDGPNLKHFAFTASTSEPTESLESIMGERA